jgi:hypothetical protein
MRALDANPRPDPAVAAAFHALAREWKEETEHLSSTEVFTHPAYQRIIGLGEPVVPLLLQDLDSGAHGFWALRAITGANPVPPQDAGRVRRMANAWLAWGRMRGLV